MPHEQSVQANKQIGLGTIPQTLENRDTCWRGSMSTDRLALCIYFRMFSKP